MSEPLEKIFAARLRHARKDLTQTEFAKFLGFTQQTYSRWEGGKLPPWHELKKIALKLSLPVHELIKDPHPSAAYELKEGDVSSLIFEDILAEAEEIIERSRSLQRLIKSLKDKKVPSPREELIRHYGGKKVSSKPAGELAEHEQLLDAAEDKGLDS